MAELRPVCAHGGGADPAGDTPVATPRHGNPDPQPLPPLPYDPLVQFGVRLARLRKQRGWSQERLALESGLARSYVGGIERGQRNLALVNSCILAATLGVPPAALLDFS